MNRTRLYIENQEIELDEEVQFLINKQWEDITNPTTIISDWSKTISIPATQKNDQVFGHCYRVDRLPQVTTAADTSNMWINHQGWCSAQYGFDSITTSYNLSVDNSTDTFETTKSITSSLSDNFNKILIRTGDYKLEEDIYGNFYYKFYPSQTLSTGISSAGNYTFKFKYQGEGSIELKFVKSDGSMSSTRYEIMLNIADLGLKTGIEYSFIFNILTLARSNNNSTLDAFKASCEFRLAQENLIGIYFDPYKKLSFRLEWNDSVLMSGYAKMSEIIRNDTKTVYNINLCGKLGDIFQKMKKITFDKSILEDTDENGEDQSQYLIDTDEFGVSAMTKDFIYNCWMADPNLYYAGAFSGSTRIDHLVGFAPNDSYNENFDYKSVCMTTGTTIASQHINDLTNYLPENFEAATSVSPDTVIGDGLIPRGFGEFRSYNQLPYIYFFKLWKIFREKSEALTGYSFVEDKDWFNVENPYWSQMVMLLNPLSEYTYKGGTLSESFAGMLNYSQSGDVNLGYQSLETDINTYYGAVVTKDYSPAKKTYNYWNFPDSEAAVGSKGYVGTFNLDEKNYTLYINPIITITDKSIYQYQWASTTDVDLYMVLEDVSGNTLSSRTLIANFVGEGQTPDPTAFCQNTVMATNPPFVGADPSNVGWSVQLSDIPLTTTSKDYKGEVYVKFVWNVKGKIVSQTQPTRQPMMSTTAAPFDWSGISRLSGNNQQVKSNKKIRSGSFFGLDTLWNNDYNIFDCILNYCKAHRIVIWTDDNKKEIHFQTQANFFYDGLYDEQGKLKDIIDWSDRVDYSKEFKIQPISWDTKYVKFNYEDSDDSLNKSYKDKYGYNFGELRVATDYNFNTDTNDLFSDLKVAIVSTDTIYDWDKLTDCNIVNDLGREKFVHCKDDDNKYQNQFGSFVFIEPIATEFDPTLRDVYITDDTPLMDARGIYCYMGNHSDVGVITAYQKRCTKYPGLTNYVENGTYAGNKYIWQTFAKPKEKYAYDAPEDANMTNSLYYFLWKNYIDERYSKKNKIVTCYVKINPVDMLNFRFNKFVKIDGQRYTINKIYDYNVTSNEPTKVELITVQDPPKLFISNYASIEYKHTEGDNLENGQIYITSPVYPVVKASTSGDTNYLSSKFDFTDVKKVDGMDNYWVVTAKLKDLYSYSYSEGAEEYYTGPSFYVTISSPSLSSSQEVAVQWDVKFNWRYTDYGVEYPASGSTMAEYGSEGYYPEFNDMFTQSYSAYNKFINSAHFSALNLDGTPCNWIYNFATQRVSGTNQIKVFFDMARNTQASTRQAYLVCTLNDTSVTPTKVRQYRVKVTQEDGTVSFEIVDFPDVITNFWSNKIEGIGVMPTDLTLNTESALSDFTISGYTKSQTAEMANEIVYAVKPNTGDSIHYGDKIWLEIWTNYTNIEEQYVYWYPDLNWMKPELSFTAIGASTIKTIDVEWNGSGLLKDVELVTPSWVTYQWAISSQRVRLTATSNYSGAIRTGKIYPKDDPDNYILVTQAAS